MSINRIENGVEIPPTPEEMDTLFDVAVPVEEVTVAAKGLAHQNGRVAPEDRFDALPPHARVYTSREEDDQIRGIIRSHR